MGRPYGTELKELPYTYRWAQTEGVSVLQSCIAELRRFPLIVVGSGGSISSCHFAALLHESHARLAARVLTPLEFVRHPVPQAAAVLLLSASGKNTDILAAAKHAVTNEYPSVTGFCMRRETPLGELLKDHRHTSIHEFEGPAGKDGFLATNSLVATMVLLGRGYGVTFPDTLPAFYSKESDEDRFASLAVSREAVIAIGHGWAVPALSDLESKWSEAGFGTVSFTDARNFAHGRHLGLSRRADDSVVVAVTTPAEALDVERTFSFLPANVRTATIRTELLAEAGAVDLLVRVMNQAGTVGIALGIDPGRPSVPLFGRRLYHNRTRSVRNRIAAPEDLWILRKVSSAVWFNASDEVREDWRTAAQLWVTAIEASCIQGVVLDYDGTICEAAERFGAPLTRVANALVNAINSDLPVGIATGRGDSVTTALRSVLPPDAWPRVLVGMYNGGVIATLADDIEIGCDIAPEIADAKAALAASVLISRLAELRIRPTQLTLRAKYPLPEGLLHRFVSEELSRLGELPIRVYSSGHTVDVISSSISKLRVVAELKRRIASTAYSRSGTTTITASNDRHGFLTIGDQGQDGGNDAEFLAGTLGLSVDRTSSDLRGCWNVAAAGLRRSSALVAYLAALRRDKEGFRLSVMHASKIPRESKVSRGHHERT